MARVKRAMMTRKRRNKILKMAKGYWGSKSKHYKMANQAMMKSLTYAYIGRRLKKRDFRSLWLFRMLLLPLLLFLMSLHPSRRQRC